MERSARSMINGAMITVTLGDITLQATDAIVNAANSGLMGGGGVDGAIHRAGGPAILEECKTIVSKQGKLPAGQAVITTGGTLPAKYVIHTVGPVWHGGSRNESATLANAYLSCLTLATEKGLNSISFPSVSTGVYGYPVEKAAVVALGSVKEFLTSSETTLKEIVFVLFNREAYQAYEFALHSVT